jgi:hypothetical protein
MGLHGSQGLGIRRTRDKSMDPISHIKSYIDFDVERRNLHLQSLPLSGGLIHFHWMKDQKSVLSFIQRVALYGHQPDEFLSGSIYLKD